MHLNGRTFGESCTGEGDPGEDSLTARLITESHVYTEPAMPVRKKGKSVVWVQTGTKKLTRTGFKLDQNWTKPCQNFAESGLKLDYTLK